MCSPADKNDQSIQERETEPPGDESWMPGGKVKLQYSNWLANAPESFHSSEPQFQWPTSGKRALYTVHLKSVYISVESYYVRNIEKE